ncbi:hypothetical protein MKK84_13475 [Methylobacterium sp. E-065]|uniref:hypothetical protein n=1 Tax=Methylobacterium sp. E-065 TaxID=2836583 RepID=UPI001FBB0B76|nr:hypothetical protein [Methylobacterium sp. E-065]MCJ2018431.1 hypothetical protein [Methylobacterium sp. E-065]
MRCLAPSLLLALWASAALALPAETARPTTHDRALTDAVFVRPVYGTYRHCGGACLKSGELSWFCFQKQSCYLSCATAPPLMRCAVP